MQFDPFDNVNCKYGAPMGRVSAPRSNLGDVPKDELVAQWQEGGEGYDKGGAYWGLPSNVYAVWQKDNGPDTVQYVRAFSFGDAIDKVLGKESIGDFERGYIEALYFTSAGPDDDLDPDDQLSTQAFESIKVACRRFQEHNIEVLEQAYATGYEKAQAGRDFWFAQSRLGVGFMDRKELRANDVAEKLTNGAMVYRGVHPYKGDDGFIHLESV